MDFPANALTLNLVAYVACLHNADAKAFDDAIRDLGIFRQHWPDALRALITSHTPIENAQAVLQGKTDGIKNVISFA